MVRGGNSNMAKKIDIDMNLWNDQTMRYAQYVYVASPLAGDYNKNVEFARSACRYVISCGYIPLASHLLYPQMLDDKNSFERQLGTGFGLRLIQLCSEVWAFGERISSGMAQEIAYATSLGIPVKYIKTF